jgi:ATP-binding cassette subfamily E protein 1
LSGSEIQRVALAICLGTPADIYLIDEPSNYLDSEQRLIAAKIIKRFVYLNIYFLLAFRFIGQTKRTAFVVEHDLMMSIYLANRIILFDGQSGIKTQANM